MPTKLDPERLNIERRYSCRTMLNFEPVAPPATGGISEINKSSGCLHVIVHTCVYGWNQLPMLLLVLYVTWSHTLLLINTLIVHTWYRKKRRSETVNKELSDFTAQPTICDHLTADQKIIECGLRYFTALCVEGVFFTIFLMKTIRYIWGKCIQTYFHRVSLS